MLEGKLEEQGREPRNIQVQLTEEEGEEGEEEGAVRTIELLGAGGAFLRIEVEPEEQDEDGHSEVEGGELEATPEATLAQLTEAEARNEALTREISEFTIQLIKSYGVSSVCS